MLLSHSLSSSRPDPHSFLTDTATTEIYTLSLHDALPISKTTASGWGTALRSFLDELSATIVRIFAYIGAIAVIAITVRSEEHTSELQSHSDLVCRLLLEKKNEDVNAGHARQTTSSERQLK